MKPLAFHVYEIGLTSPLTEDQSSELLRVLSGFAQEGDTLYHSAVIYGKTREYEVEDVNYQSVFINEGVLNG